MGVCRQSITLSTMGNFDDWLEALDRDLDYEFVSLAHLCVVIQQFSLTQEGKLFGGFYLNAMPSSSSSQRTWDNILRQLSFLSIPILCSLFSIFTWFLAGVLISHGVFCVLFFRSLWCGVKFPYKVSSSLVVIYPLVVGWLCLSLVPLHSLSCLLSGGILNLVHIHTV